MTVISLDQIVKNILLKRRYSIHYYLDFLVPAKDCLRELSFDLPMNTLRYKVLTLNSNNAVELPNDYQDWANVSYRMNQYLIPLIEDGSLDLVPNYDSNFDIQPYNQGIATDVNPGVVLYNGYLSPYWYMYNMDVYGENLGRQFGGVGGQADTFKINKARNEIKINENLAVTEIVLEYIGNGMDGDSATHIDLYAQATIEAYCMWQFYVNNRTYGAGEARVGEQEFIKQYQILRARFSDLTIDRLKRLVQHNNVAIKY